MSNQQILRNPPTQFIQAMIAQGKIRLQAHVPTVAEIEREDRNERLRKLDKALFMQRLRAERRGQDTSCFPSRVRI